MHKSLSELIYILRNLKLVFVGKIDIFNLKIEIFVEGYITKVE